MNVDQYAYNVKVYPHDWFVAIRNLATNDGKVYHNDAQTLMSAVQAPGIFGGFGSKLYDKYIIKAIHDGMSPEEVYSFHSFIKSGSMPWDYPRLSKGGWTLQDTDLSDDTTDSLNVSVIAGHLGLEIPRYNVSEGLNRPLTPEECTSVVSSMVQENRVVSETMRLRESYLDAKETLSGMANMGLKGLGVTNAKLCSVLLGAKKKSYNDAREYKYPSNLKTEYIPNEVFDFVNKIFDQSLSDKEVFSGRSVTIDIGGCAIKIANGGVHGAVAGYDSSKIPSGRILVILDVTGFYPSLIIQNNYISRSISDPSAYTGIVSMRKEAKAAGNLKVSNPLKTVVNCMFGGMLDPNNALYDPLMGRSTVYSGQLYLVELLNHLATDVQGLKVVQGNTDGFTVECNESDLQSVFAIVNEWQDRTGLNLERDTSVSRIIQKNVNSYIIVKNDGSIKVKGELNRGVDQSTSFRVNNNAPIICEAVARYAVDGTPIEKTISECTDIRKFQYIANASRAAKCFTVINNTEHLLGAVNRVYATRNLNNGSIYALTAKGTSKLPNVPDHCVVDNDNKLQIRDIDLNYYIKSACDLAVGYVGHTVEPKVVAFDRFSNLKVEDVEIDMDELLLEEDVIDETVSKETARQIMPIEKDLQALEEQHADELISNNEYNQKLAALMPQFVSQLMLSYRNQVIPNNISEELKETHKKYLPTWISDSMIESGKSAPLFDVNGTKVCDKYSRVVISDFGAFIEFSYDDICEKNIMIMPGEEYRVAPENQDKVSSYLLTTNSDAKCQIGLRVKDGTGSGFRQGFCYVSVYEVIDEAIMREFSDDPVIRMGLDKYGIEELLNSIENENLSGNTMDLQSKNSGENLSGKVNVLIDEIYDKNPFGKVLVEDYCIYREEINGTPYVAQCHIFSGLGDMPYLNVMRIPEKELVTIYSSCDCDVDKTEEIMFTEAMHMDIPILDERFSKCVDHIKRVVENRPETLVAPGDVSKTLETNIKSVSEVRGVADGVLQ